MRIAIDAHVFDEKFQGSRTYLEGIYREAIGLKPDWEFYFLAQNTEILRATFGHHKHVHYVPLESKNKYTRLLFELPILLKRLKIDYAHFQYITPFFKVCRYFVTTHDVLLLERAFKRYFPWKYRMINGYLFTRSAKRSALVLTVSAYSKDKIIENFKLDPSSVYVTPNAVMKPSIKAAPNYIQKRHGIEKYILYVSRVEPRKNHLTLLRAFVNLKLHEKGYSLVFIGAKDLPYPELNAFLENQTEDIRNRVLHFPGISGEELQYFYANADVFVYPSLAEGFGIPPLEAAMFDTPVICSNATAMKDFSFFQHHINPENTAALENALKEVFSGKIDDPEFVKGEIEYHYCWKRSAEVLVQAIEENHKRK